MDSKTMLILVGFLLIPLGLSYIYKQAVYNGYNMPQLTEKRAIIWGILWVLCGCGFIFSAIFLPLELRESVPAMLLIAMIFFNLTLRVIELYKNRQKPKN